MNTQLLRSSVIEVGCSFVPASRLPSWQLPGRPCRRASARPSRCRPPSRGSATALVPSAAAVEGPKKAWQGDDEFTNEDDRHDLPPLALPPLPASKRVVLVRHGQSTWNAEGRIQGSSDFAVLTPKGEAQAETTRQMLQGESFHALYHSPLARAKRTGEIIWGDRQGAVTTLPSLREIDLYSFQGLLKAEGKAQYGNAFRTWQMRSAEFELDGHAPVRELWYRASLAWQRILAAPEEQSVLVVAHNAVNQALIGAALRLPPTYFRRLLQSNAAVTVLDCQPSADGGPPRVTVDRLNQSPGLPFTPDGSGRSPAARVVLVRHCATLGTGDGLVLGSLHEPLSTLGEVHAVKTGELLLDMKVDTVVSSPMERAAATAGVLAKLQLLAGQEEPAVQLLAGLANPHLGSWEGMPAMQLRGVGLPPDAEPLPQLWQRTGEAWRDVLTMLLAPEARVNDAAQPNVPPPCRNVVVVGHALVLSALLCHCLGLDTSALPQWRIDPGGVTIIDFPDGPSSPGVVRTANYTAHLGRWAVPITRDDLDAVCGIDGCF